MELKALITIVVPIYQVEAYLERCIDSIRAQTLMAFTCLLIYDGSRGRGLQLRDAQTAQIVVGAAPLGRAVDIAPADLSTVHYRPRASDPPRVEGRPAPGLR